MLCCVSRKASARPSSENNQKQQKPIDSDCSGSSSGFSESSSASSGDFASSGFSATSSSSGSSSGFSSAPAASHCTFPNSSSDSSSFGSEFSNRFDVPADYLANRPSLTPDFIARGSFSTSASSAKGLPPTPPKRLLTFSTPSSVQNRANSGNEEVVVGKEQLTEDEPPVLLPCAICARTFKPQSLEKHTRICERSAIKKRKPFDSAKQRIQGTDLAEFLPKETTKKKFHQEEKPIAAAVPSKGSWKQTHDEFVKAIRAARGEAIETPAQRQAVAASHVTVGAPTRPNEKGMCPTCNRQFSIKSYERHVAWCKDRDTRVQVNPATNIAKERLEARMKYRAPLLKNRRPTNREKYSPGSAVNLSSYASKNSLANNTRAKESASSPNCNNKGGNEATMGGGNQYHKKATVNAKRSGQGREGTSSGPMKSRLSDRSSRPSAEIESGPTTNRSPCPVPPRINMHRHSRLSPTRAIPLSNLTSPLATSRSISKPESSRTPCGTSRRITENDRKMMELNISSGAKHYQRLNIVSARSHGHPKVNDIAVNDEIIGMTVQRCGLRENNAKQAREGLVTWKQISEDSNLIKMTKFLRLNDDKNFTKFEQKPQISETEPIVENELNYSLRSSFNSDNSGTSGMKKLNQTYLIGESVDVDQHLSDVPGRRTRRPVVNSPRTEFDYVERASRKNYYNDLGSDAPSPSRFNAEINVTSSPLKGRKENKRCEDNFSRAMSPSLSARRKLAPLDLKMIHDEISNNGDTSRSGASTASSLQTCRRTLAKNTPKLKPIRTHEPSCEDSLNLKINEINNYENFKASQHFQGFEEFNLKVNHSSLSTVSTATAKEDCGRDLADKILEMKPISRGVDDCEKTLSFRLCTEEHAEHKYYDENVQEPQLTMTVTGSHQLLHTSISPEIKPKSEKQLNDDESLGFEIDIEDTARKEHSSKRFENVTSTNSSRELLTKKISKIRSADEEVLACDKISSESLDERNWTTLINDRHSFQDVHLEINYDTVFQSSDTPKSARSAATAIMTCRRSLTKETPKLTAEAEPPCREQAIPLNNNYRSEEGDEHLTDQVFACSEVEASDKHTESDCNDTLENELDSRAENSVNTSAENIEQTLVEPAELSMKASNSEILNNTIKEQPKNFRRCGTYVIDRAPSSKVTTKHPTSDESVEEKPLPKRRRTEEDVTSNPSEKSPIPIETSEKKSCRDLEPEKNLTNARNCFSNCLANDTINTAKGLERAEFNVELIDQDVREIKEKYVNQNFYYDSDNTGDNNLIKDDDSEISITPREKLSLSNETPSYDLHPKACSDSIVPQRMGSAISHLKSKEEHVVQDSTEMRRKLKKKMSLLRGSTDTLISSVEASVKITDEKSLCVNEAEITPMVERETIEELDFAPIGKVAASKTSCCSFLPEIPVERIASNSGDTGEKKCAPFDGTSFWERVRRNSSTRLINLDPPRCRETRVRNTRNTRPSDAGNLPPVVPASFRKERRRSSDRESRAVWSNYVRRRPDFNLVLTGRTGSCKDYDPFVLAERQMNELLSDTCSDQSFPDSPGNNRRSLSPSSPNYPLSHSSAFVKYPDPVTRNLGNPEKRASLIAPPTEFDDLNADFSSDSTETNSISQEILADLEDSRPRENGFDLRDSRNHVLGRRVIIDKSKALGMNEVIEDSSRKNSQTNEKARKILDKLAPKVVRPQVTRSSSVRATSAPKAPERKNNNSSSVTTINKINLRSSPGSGLNNRNNNYTSLSGSNASLSSIVSSEVEVKRSNSLFDDLASSFEDDASGNYPSLRSLLKNDSLSVASPLQSNRHRNGQISDEELSSPDSYQRQDHSKLSADSAYSSLNRKYSNHGRSTSDVAGRLEEDSGQRRREGDASTTSLTKSKLSKFCHECGCKFPETAKFCCECGIRRLAL